MSEIIELESKYTSGIYAKRNLAIVRGRGALLYDEQGNEYIDCVGGQGAANLGHAHPAITAAIAEQADRLVSCPEIFYNDRRSELESRLASFAPAGIERVFLCNSGTEAVEAALKFARVSTGRKKIIAAMRGFHGRTLGALSATWNKKFRKPFEPLLPDFVHLPYNRLERFEETIDSETAAVILEVVQGEGGVHPGSAEFLLGVQELCRQHGALLIIDEVQTGFGRTGRMLACEHHNLQPDMICLAKSIAGGFPMGAVLIGERVGDLPKGIHASTFGGNPLACAASLATLDVLENENLPERAAVLGEHLITRLGEIESPTIRDVRGIGLMIGIDVRQKVAPYLSALMSRGILALPAGMSVIRLLPPLVISEAQINIVLQNLEEVLCRDD